MNKKGMQTVRLARKSSGSKRSKRTRTDTSGKHSHMFCSFLSCFFDCDDFSDVNIFWFSGPVTSTPGQVKHSKRSLFSSPSGITSASLQHLSVSEGIVRCFSVDHILSRMWFDGLYCPFMIQYLGSTYTFTVLESIISRRTVYLARFIPGCW